MSTIADKAYVEENKWDKLLRMQKVLNVFLIKILTDMSTFPSERKHLFNFLFPSS